MFKKEVFTFNDDLILQHPKWAPYFKCSTVGNQYTVLYYDDGTTQKAIMSDTEYEQITNQPLLDLVQAKFDAGITAPNILLIGWGIGYVIDPIKAIAPNAEITVIEKYQDVIDLTPLPNDINLIVDDVANVDLETEFDIIWSDVTEVTNESVLIDIKLKFEPNLKSDGTFQYWLANCNCS